MAMVMVMVLVVVLYLLTQTDNYLDASRSTNFYSDSYIIEQVIAKERKKKSASEKKREKKEKNNVSNVKCVCFIDQKLGLLFEQNVISEKQTDEDWFEMD